MGAIPFHFAIVLATNSIFCCHCVQYGGGFPHTDIAANASDEASVHGVLRELLPSWIEGAGKFTCDKIGGGVTNHLLRCHPESRQSETRELLFRVYGEGTGLMVDRHKETSVLVDLSVRGYPTGLYGTFANGRVEKFLEGRVLTLDEMRQPHFRKLIARSLAKLHSVSMPGDPSTPSLWASIEKWFGLIEEGQMQLPLGLEVKKLRDMVAVLSHKVEAANAQIVFAHNDVQPLNMMYGRAEEFTLIDFEYSAQNYRGYDVANHFCEYAGFGPIRFELLPDKETEKSFIAEYLAASLGVGQEMMDQQISKLVEEVELFKPASHLFWGLWGVVQHTNSDIDFDFRAYAEDRLQAFVDASKKLHLGRERHAEL